MSTNQCPNCQAANRPGAKFCHRCGNSIQPVRGQPKQAQGPPESTICPNCKHTNRLQAKHCVACGHSLAPAPAPSPEPAKQVKVRVGGGISGQMIVGDNNMQVGSLYGNILKVILPEDQPEPVRRPTPIIQRPAPFQGFLNRESERKQVVKALKSGKTVELQGEPGIGKTTLLKYLAHHPELNTFPDGIIQEAVLGRSAEDVLQYLFEVFYTTGQILTKRTEAELDNALQPIQALILLDDVRMDRDEVGRLIDTIPGCGIILASKVRQLWGRKTNSMKLKGLSPEDAIQLVEDELGYPLKGGERKAAIQFCKSMNGHPLNILQAAARSKAEGIPLNDLAERVKKPSTLRKISESLIGSLSQAERRVAHVLAVMQDIPLDAAQLSALANVPDITRVLDAMQQRALVRTNSPRYVLTPLAVPLIQADDLDSVAAGILNHYVNWAQRQNTIGPLLAESDVVLRILSWGVGAHRWDQVLRLSRAFESAMALGRRWGAWVQVLRWGLKAAQSLKDKSSEAWFLHQLGTRSFCMGELKAARTYLEAALSLRESLGEREAAAATRHNLNLVRPRPVPKPVKRSARGFSFSKFAWAAVSAAVVLVASFTAWQLWGPLGDDPTPVAVVASRTPTTVVVIIEDTPTPIPPTATRRPTETLSPTRTPVQVTQTPVPIRLPDLVIVHFEVLEPAEFNEEVFQIELPVLVIIQNLGGLPADIFKVSMEYSNGEGTFTVPFRTETGDEWYAYSDRPLGPGEEIVFEGFVIFQGYMEGSTVLLRAIADSCAGDELMPEFCRVEEENEENNLAEIWVDL